MLPPKAFENWAVSEKDRRGQIITEQRMNAAHKDLFEKHPKDLPTIICKMVMGFFRMMPLEFEKKYFPVIYAANMKVQRLENTPKSTIEKLINNAHLDTELCEYQQICLHKTRDYLALAPYKRNRLSAETYANFCLEYFDTSADEIASPVKQITTPNQNPQVLQHTSPPPSYAHELQDTPAIHQTNAIPAAEPSFTAELEAAPEASRCSTKFDAELREYKQVSLKTNGDLAYALYLRGRFSEEEYTKFCAEFREGDIPK